MNPARTVLYLHGLASSPRGRKTEALRHELPRSTFRVIAPDLNVPSFERLSFVRIVDRAVEEVRAEKPDLVVGSSLGALVALSLMRRSEVPRLPLVLVAPALAFGARWKSQLPEDDAALELFHHGEGRSLPIHREFFEAMAAVEVEDEPPDVPVIAFMGENDETVPCAQVVETWTRWEASGRLVPPSRLVVIEGGDHSLLGSVGEFAAAIRELLGP